MKRNSVNSNQNFKARSVTFNQEQSITEEKDSINKELMDKLFKKAKRQKPGLNILQTYGNSKALVNKFTLPSINNNMMKELEEQRKQLENLRLQEDSQSTRLMKIQKHERSVTQQYENQKKQMESDLDQLAKDASNHNKEQINMNKKLENDDKIAILNCDKKIKYFKDQMMKDRDKNINLESEIRECESDIQQKKQIIEEKNCQIEELQIYENFLQEIEVNFREDDYTEGIQAIINKFEQLDKIQQDLTIEDQQYDQEINKILKESQILRTKIVQNNIKGTSDMNKLKKEIEEIQEENRKMEDNQQSIEKQKLQRQIDQGQLIMAIKNIFQTVVSNNNQKSLIQQQQEQEQTQKKNKKLLQQTTLQQTAENLLKALDLEQEKAPTQQEQLKLREEKLKERFSKNQITKEQMVQIIQEMRNQQDKQQDKNQNQILKDINTMNSTNVDNSLNCADGQNLNEEDNQKINLRKKFSKNLKSKLNSMSEKIKEQKNINYNKEIEENNREQRLIEQLEEEKRQIKNKPKEDSTSNIVQMLKLIQKTMIHLQKVEAKYEEKLNQINTQTIMNQHK